MKTQAIYGRNKFHLLQIATIKLNAPLDSIIPKPHPFYIYPKIL